MRKFVFVKCKDNLIIQFCWGDSYFKETFKSIEEIGGDMLHAFVDVFNDEFILGEYINDTFKPFVLDINYDSEEMDTIGIKFNDINNLNKVEENTYIGTYEGNSVMVSIINTEEAMKLLNLEN